MNKTHGGPSCLMTCHSELEIPPHMVPPNPDDSESAILPHSVYLFPNFVLVLPSHIHPSYPYGNPTNLNHPAALPNIASEPLRALYQDIGYSGENINATLRWKELGLDLLLPVNQAKEEAVRAAVARKMASGAAQNHAHGTAIDQNIDDDDDSNEDGEEDDEDEEEEDEEEDEGEGEYYEVDASRGSFDTTESF